MISRLLDKEPGILSTGGGAFLAEANRENISARGVSVWLDADLDLLWNRVRYKTSRPLLRTADPRGTLTELYEKRVPIYRLADMTVASTPALSIDAMVSAWWMRSRIVQMYLRCCDARNGSCRS